VESSVDGGYFAKATSGFSGADIQNMVFYLFSLG
jgi:hypothetical protein